ncbi:MAG: NAD(P)-dependent glycerol-3-phosphate dehydrogenase [Deltaproteobacteria bacterium]|nr:NAD(P)-dependent glycerol-3-phosphate dehydrogenase [Deltaproteobacteria bacterium]MBW2395220.1 NAD(P)-dependent glycerol-3-phosphate dehydrogenase [Deltaproteobacteria bacterium]
MPTPVAVLGAGSFGTCLAVLAAREHDVTIWARDPETAESIERERRNPRYLNDIELPDNIKATADLNEALTDREIVICAVPSHGVREVMGRAGKVMDPNAILVSTVKGIEVETGMTMHRVLEDVLPEALHPRIVCLSGPSFAREIAEQKPTAVTLACREESYAIAVQTALSCPWFRCYTHDDVVGVEVGGALKNVVAIAVGICDGLETGMNARAGLMTRGLREITRLGQALGANPLTFLGLSGMGDLVLTCTGDLSRNRNVGLEIGRGRGLDEIVGSMNQVAEGIRTTFAVCELATRLGVDMPIAFGVRQILLGEVDPQAGGMALMIRQLRSENE